MPSQSLKGVNIRSPRYHYRNWQCGRRFDIHGDRNPTEIEPHLFKENAYAKNQRKRWLEGTLPA